MTLTFADTHNMVAHLNKSDASEGFNQIIDFLNGSYVAYALTVNPTIYVSCIKQFWNIVVVKQSNDVTRLQALVDKKKVVVTEATIGDALHLDDAEGVECLPNEEIFTTLARMGYEKPSTNLTFYKAFFSSQWKFLIHTILQSMKEQGAAEEHGTDNTAAKEPVTAVNDVADHSIQSPTLLTPAPQQPQDIPSTSQVAQDLEILKLKTRVKKMERANKVKTVKLRRLRKVRTSKMIESLDDTLIEDVSNQGRVIVESDKDEGAKLMIKEEEKETKEVRVNPDDAQVEGRHADIYHIDMDHATKVLSMQEDEPKIQEAVEVVITAKLIIKVVAVVSETVSAAAIVQADVPAALVNTATVMTSAAPVKRYQVTKRPQTEAQVQRNMMVYLKNTAGFTLDYFKGMTYDDIRPIFEAKFNANMKFLLKSKEQLEEEESRAIALINKTPAQKEAKRRRLNEEAEDVEELKQHLEIVPNEDDDVYTKATPLARKVPVVDYQIVHVNNKP
nr:hypothetical protein [Tanacetum cinerariifolium]